jgi:hypothetical protein
MRVFAGFRVTGLFLLVVVTGVPEPSAVVMRKTSEIAQRLPVLTTL